MNPTTTKDKVNKPSGAGQAGQSARTEPSSGAEIDRMSESSHSPEQGGDIGAAIERRAEQATSAVGGGMKQLAGTIREKMPKGGKLGSAGAAVAEQLESGGEYLQEKGLQGIADDLTDMIRKNPIPALLVAVGVGYLLARVTRS